MSGADDSDDDNEGLSYEFRVGDKAKAWHNGSVYRCKILRRGCRMLSEVFPRHTRAEMKEVHRIRRQTGVRGRYIAEYYVHWLGWPAKYDWTHNLMFVDDDVGHKRGWDAYLEEIRDQCGRKPAKSKLHSHRGVEHTQARKRRLDMIKRERRQVMNARNQDRPTKRRRIVLEEPVARAALPIPIPPKLKQHLVHDDVEVTAKRRVVPLPKRTTAVSSILDHFVKGAGSCEADEERWQPEELRRLCDVVARLFRRCVWLCLHESEVGQFEELREQSRGNLENVYGAEHLLRFLVHAKSFADGFSDDEGDLVSVLQALAWHLANHYDRYFTVNDYVQIFDGRTGE